MSNTEKYLNAFTESLEIKPEQTVGLKYQAISNWDSVGHMSLITSLEEAFDVMLEMDDIIDLNSYEAGMEILKKYDVEF